MNRPIRTFARHYVEMVLAMVLGMLVLYPLWVWAVMDIAWAWVDRPETEALAMATTMAIPMAIWMRVRGHRWAPTLEMCLAMYAGFVVLFPSLWWGNLAGDDMLTFGHVQMLLFMLATMLLRRSEYAGHHRRPARPDVPAGLSSE